MKTKINLLLLAVCSVLIMSTAFVQAGQNAKSDRKTMRKMNKSIAEETKKLQKMGYHQEIGAPAMEFQLRRAYEKEFDEDENGNQRFIIASGSSIAGIENVARMHALSDAAANASVKIETKLMGLIETGMVNNTYSKEEFESLSKMNGVFSQLLAQRLRNADVLTAFIRDQGKYYEYQIRVAYSKEEIQDQAESVTKELLSKENDQLRKKFERLTGFDKLVQ